LGVLAERHSWALALAEGGEDSADDSSSCAIGTARVHVRAAARLMQSSPAAL
jgi:hypothetical protein